MEDTGSVPRVGEWLHGQSMFITGASGLVGKILLEKLLRDCPGIEKAYILLRGKKGKGVAERLDVLKESTAFNLLKETNPNALDKIVPVSGDISSVGLGLSDEDRSMLQQNVSVVFHVAASVKFDDPLKYATFVNTRATRDAVELAKGMKNLQIFVYVSTAYTNCEHKVIKEKVYPSKIDWRKMIQAVETMPEHELNVISEKLLGDSPNTYIFSKNLAEHVVWDHRHDIPVIIYRPSVVVSSIREPEPGWIDSFNSPVALIGAVGKGVLRVHGGPLDTKTEYVAVDTTVNGMIAAAWYHGCYLPRHPHLMEQKETLMTYNATSNAVTTGEISDYGLGAVANLPMSNHLWRVYFVSVPNKHLYLFFTVLVHFLPGLLYDLLFKAVGMKIRLAKIYRAIYLTSTSLRVFMFNEWVVHKSNFDSLPDSLQGDDKNTLRMDTVTEDFTIGDYFINAALVGRRYLFKEPPIVTPEIWKHTRRMYWIDMAARCLLVGLIYWALPLHTIYSYACDMYHALVDI